MNNKKVEGIRVNPVRSSPKALNPGFAKKLLQHLSPRQVMGRSASNGVNKTLRPAKSKLFNFSFFKKGGQNKKTKVLPKTISSQLKSPKTTKEKKGLVFFLRFSIKEQMHFIKRLSFLIYSGVPILDSLHILKKQTRSRGKGKVLDHLIADVSNGRPLSASLARFDKVFSNFTISVVRVGELSGNLSKNLTYLAEELGKKQALRRKIISALVYPAFITIASVSLVVLLVVYIFPKIMPIFFSLNAELPFTTRSLLWFSNFLQEWGVAVFGGGIILAILFFVAHRFLSNLRFLVALGMLKLPVVGRLIQNYNMTDFCRTFSLLLKSGFTVSQSAEILADSNNNPLYKREYVKLGEHIIKGKRIAAHLEKSPKLFPDMVTHMVMIGETSGDLSGTMFYLSEYYEAEVDEQIKNLSSSIEPILMILMGVVVGFVAVSVITPIYQITQSLSR